MLLYKKLLLMTFGTTLVEDVHILQSNKYVLSHQSVLSVLCRWSCTLQLMYLTDTITVSMKLV